MKARTLSTGQATVASLLLLLIARPAAADTVHDEQLWLKATVSGPIAGDVVYVLEMQPRFGNGASRLNQMILRGAVGVQITPDVALYQGYARFDNARALAPDAIEDRSFQQLNLALGKPAGGELTARTRVEQRWRSDGDDLSWRLNQLLRFEHPLRQGSAAPVPAWVVSGEAQVTLNESDWGPGAGLEQLRGFAGLELPLSGKSTVEVGYLNQSINRAGRGWQINHVASLSLLIRH